MASLELLRRHQFATAAAIGLLLGGVAGLFFPIRAASPPKSDAQAWVLPAVAETKRFHQEAYESLRAARFWKTVETPGQRGSPKVEWTLVAIISKPLAMAAVSQPGVKQPSSLVMVGAELPDGATLLRLTRDAVWFEKDGCIRERRLYRRVTAENNVCQGQAGNGSPDPAKPDPQRPTATPAASPRSGNEPARPTLAPPRAAGAATP